MLLFTTIILAVATLLAALIERGRRQNTREHGENTRLLRGVAEDLGEVKEDVREVRHDVRHLKRRVTNLEDVTAGGGDDL